MKVKISKKRWEHFKRYHIAMTKISDCDPAYPAMKYIAKKEKWSMEQRYWVSWIYSCCYCSPTAYYILKCFPHYNEIKIKKLSKWWDKNKSKLLFQTDRAKVKNFNLFPKMFESYNSYIGSKGQEDTFRCLCEDNTREEMYDTIYKFTNNFYYFGRFSLFLYLETMNVLTDLNMKITGIDLKDADSTRNGLCYSLGLDDWVIKHGEKGVLSKGQYNILDKRFKRLIDELQEEDKDGVHNYWNVETSLCGYKKLYWKTRYLGYYVDRALDELKTMEKNAPEIDWSIWWEFRKKNIDKAFRGEVSGWDGVRKDKMGLYDKDKKLMKVLNRMGL